MWKRLYANICIISLRVMVKRYFTVRGFARILGVSKITVYRWIWEGKVKAIMLPSGRYRIPESELKKIKRGRR